MAHIIRVILVLQIFIFTTLTFHNLVVNGSSLARRKGKNGYSAAIPQIKVVTDYIAKLGDGPYWDAQANDLYYVDANIGEFIRLNVVTKEMEKIKVGESVSIIIPYQNEPGNFVISQKNQIYKLNWPTQTTALMASLPLTREKLNDGKADPRGRLFIGSIKNLLGLPEINGGSLYRLDGNELTQVAHGFTIANGMAWSNDGNHTKFYLNDTEGRRIHVFDYDIQTGTMSNGKVLVNLHQNEDFGAAEYPDGMAMDEYGFLWVCMYAGGRVVKIDVDTARVVDQVKLPTVGEPSSLARGFYEGQDGFFVTTGQGLIAHKPDDGKILHISFQGALVNSFIP